MAFGRKKKEDKPVEPEVAVEPEMEPVAPALSVDVETPNGITRNVNGSDAEEVAQGVVAVSQDPVVVQPDINNPDHANKTLAEMQELGQN